MLVEARPSALFFCVVFIFAPAHAVDVAGACDSLLNFYNVVPQLIRSSTSELCDGKTQECDLLTVLVTNEARQDIHNTRKELSCLSGDLDLADLPSACQRINALPEHSVDVLRRVFAKTPFRAYAGDFAAAATSGFLAFVESNLQETMECPVD